MTWEMIDDRLNTSRELLSEEAQVWLAIEVVLGYIMLGGLISIFANKLAKIGRGFMLNRVGFGYMAAAWSLIDRGER